MSRKREPLHVEMIIDKRPRIPVVCLKCKRQLIAARENEAEDLSQVLATRGVFTIQHNVFKTLREAAKRSCVIEEIFATLISTGKPWATFA